ncbi:MAG TPA: MFS transporter [Pseudonocardiaceae bacterium]
MTGGRTDTARGGMLSPLRHRSFRLLASARTIDYLGNGMAPIALSFAVLDRTGSVTDLGLVIGARSLANVLLLLVGGVLADRFPRAVVLQGSAALAAVSQAVVAASVLGHFDSLALLAGLGVLNGAASAASLPAAAALTNQTVPPNLVRQANALARMGIAAAGIVGSSVGGVMVGTLGPGWALATDSASFVIVAVLFSRMRLDETKPRVRASMLRELRVGWRTFVANTWVWAIVLQFLVFNAVVTGGINVLGPSIAQRTIGRTAWGLVLAGQTLGSLLGGLFAAHWQPRRALFFGVVACFVDVLPLLALGYLPNLATLLAAMFLSGFLITQFGVAWAVALQRNIPEDKLARVYSYDALGSFVAIPIGQVAAGPIALAFGDPSTLAIGAGLIVLATAAVLVVPSVRTLTISDRR